MTTVFAWDDTATVPLVIQDGNDYYIYGPDGLPIERLGVSPKRWLITDGFANVAGAFDINGQLATTQTFDTWGTPTGTNGDPITLGWQSQYRDTETGYYYLQHRYYDPATAQFTTPDPLNELSGSRYGYAYNDPVNGSDPLGLWCPLGTNPNGSCRGSGLIPNCVAIGNSNCESIGSTHEGLRDTLIVVAGISLTIASGGTAIALTAGAGTVGGGEALLAAGLGAVLATESYSDCRDGNALACVGLWTGLGSVGLGMGIGIGGPIGLGLAWTSFYFDILSAEASLFDACHNEL